MTIVTLLPGKWERITGSFKTALALTVALTMSLGASRAWAQDLIDPATLQIGTTGNVPPAPNGPGGEVVKIGSSGLVSVYQNQASAGNLNQPFLLILGIANDLGSNFFSGPSPLQSVVSRNPYDTGTLATGTGTLGGTVPAWLSSYDANHPKGGTAQWGASTGYAGTMTASSGPKGTAGEAYSTIGGLGNDDQSNNFGNWSTYDQSINGITVNEFGIYVFQISAELDGNGVVSVQFDPSRIPVGTFVIAYGQNSTHLFDTPFTEAGLTTGGVLPSPAPSTMALAFSATGVLGLVAWRRSSRRPAVTLS